jgi:hypothetical protein
MGPSHFLGQDVVFDFFFFAREIKLKHTKVARSGERSTTSSAKFVRNKIIC